MMRFFNCPLDGVCIAPGRMVRKEEYGGELREVGPRVCGHFRADGSRLVCSYAREEVCYPEEGPLPPAGRSPRAVTTPTGSGFWSNSYVSARTAGRGRMARPARSPGEAPGEGRTGPEMRGGDNPFLVP